MKPSVSIIIPTIGRKTLLATVESFADNLHPRDQVHIVVDGRDDRVRRMAEEWGNKYWGGWFYYEQPKLGFWGHPARNRILNLVDTDLVWTIDDDDIAAPGALEAIRSTQNSWAIFRMTFMEGHFAQGITCWRTQNIKQGDIGTPMIVAKPSKARFGESYDGDYYYAEALKEEFGPPAWDERVIALIRPEEIK